MELLKFLIACGKFFLPPKSVAPEHDQLSWRYKVASTLATLLILMILGCLLSLGQFPSISHGFAMTDDEETARGKIRVEVATNRASIVELKQTLAELREDQLDTKLYDIRGRQCAAIITKNRDALNSEGERLRETLPRYHSLTQEDWRIPPCNEY